MKKALWLLMILCVLVGAYALAEGNDLPPAALEEETLVILEDGPVPAPPETDGQRTSIDGDRLPEPIAGGEPAPEFIVGATSKLTGAFFTSMWGDNTTDIDVRHMVHGYSPVYWSSQPGYSTDSNVVLSIDTSMKEDGGRLYILQLHEHLRYSDGTPITAYDYAFSYLLGAAPEIQQIGGAANLSAHVAGYEAFHSGESPVFAGVRIYDPYTLGIEIDPQFLPFFYDLGYLSLYPYPIHVIAPGCEVADDGEGAYIRNEDPGIQSPIFTADLLMETILHPDTGYLSYPAVSCGPYTLTSYDRELGEARFAVNPYFIGDWEGVKPTIDNVVLRHVEPGSMMEALASGEVHLLNKVVAADNITDGLTLMSQGKAMSENYPRLGLGFINFTCDSGVFASQGMRQAIGYLIDTEALTLEFTKGFAITTYGYYGVGQWMYQAMLGLLDEAIGQATETEAWQALVARFNALNPYHYNMDAAISLLESEGYRLNEEGQPYEAGRDTIRYKEVEGTLTPLTIRFGKLEGSLFTETLQDMIGPVFEEAGIALMVEPLSYPDLLRAFYRQSEQTYDMVYLATNFMDIFDPSPMFSTESQHLGQTNMTGLGDEELSALAFRMRRTPPGDLFAYEEAWVAFQEAFNEKLPMLPIYSNIYFDFHTPDLSEYFPHLEMSFPVALLRATYAPGGLSVDGADIVTPDISGGLTPVDEAQPDGADAPDGGEEPKGGGIFIID